MSSGVVFLLLIRRMFSLRESCFVGGLLSGFFMGGIMNRDSQFESNTAAM